MPSTPVIGVLISWLITARKSLMARVAFSALSRSATSWALAPRTALEVCKAIHSKMSITIVKQIGRVEDGRGGLGQVGIAPFPVPAHQTGRADLPHPAFRLASSRGRRSGANVDMA